VGEKRMSKKVKTGEAVHFNDDYPVVIMNVHISPEEAMIIAEHDIGDIELDYGKCIGVRHFWAKYQFVSENDEPLDDYDLTPGKDSLWYIYETTKRPKGVVKRVTVLEFDE
jgi:hypothetical protein